MPENNLRQDLEEIPVSNVFPGEFLKRSSIQHGRAWTKVIESRLAMV